MKRLWNNSFLCFSIKPLGTRYPPSLSTISIYTLVCPLAISSSLTLTCSTLSPSSTATKVPSATSSPWQPSPGFHPGLREDTGDADMMQAGQDRAVIVTVGRGFNDLIGGYPNSPIRAKGHERLEWYFLLWEASNWEQGCLQVQDDDQNEDDQNEDDQNA